jgi:hypothetical protein
LEDSAAQLTKLSPINNVANVGGMPQSEQTVLFFVSFFVSFENIEWK